MVSRAFGAGLALMLMVLVLFAIARFIGGKSPGELSRRQRRRMQRAPLARSLRSRVAARPQPQLSEA